MAGQPDISQILAKLAAQRPTTASMQTQPSFPQQAPSTQSPSFLPPPIAASLQYSSLPQPTSSGSIDLRNIKPVSSGSVSLADALAQSQSIDHGGTSIVPYDRVYRTAEPIHRSTPSRSRSPMGSMERDRYADNYNPYRDDRRVEHYRQDIGTRRKRSASPEARGSHPRSSYPQSKDRGGSASNSCLASSRSPMMDDNVEVIFIEAGRVGSVIGRQGETLRRIEADTGARIQFAQGIDASGPHRQCKITGNKTAREHAKIEIHLMVEGRDNGSASATGRAPPPPGRGLSAGPKPTDGYQKALRVDEVSDKIMVPDRTVGLIIGRGGETIRDLQERSRCHVNIVGENQAVNGLRPVNLIGTLQTTARAKELILEIVELDAKNQANQGGVLKDNAKSMDLGSREIDKVNDTVFVPGSTVGLIIGKGGETIREIQNTAGCKINVTPASGSDVEREIGLVGTRAAIEQAKVAIMDKVRSVQEKTRLSNPQQHTPPSSNLSAIPFQQSPYQASSQQTANQSPYQTPPQQPLQMPVFPEDPPGGEEAYAAYGGYQNYKALWKTSIAANQVQIQQQSSSFPAGPPGYS